MDQQLADKIKALAEEEFFLSDWQDHNQKQDTFYGFRCGYVAALNNLNLNNMATSIQYNGNNAADIIELFKHLEVEEEQPDPTVEWKYLRTKIGHLYPYDYAVIDSNGKYGIYKPAEYETAKAAGLLKDAA